MNGRPRSWWGERFIGALERFTDPDRLGRGRSLGAGRNGRIRRLKLSGGRVCAKVAGGAGPDGGAAPVYTTTLSLAPVPARDWQPLLRELGNRAALLTRLLLNELPDDVEVLAGEYGIALLPNGPKDFATDCNCPDYVNPCKHVAGVCYCLASLLDNDPLLLFELRGLSRAALRRSLLDTPLGSALAATLAVGDEPFEADPAYYPRLQPAGNVAPDYDAYWYGTDDGDDAGAADGAGCPPATVTGAVLKRGGDQPPFWRSERSFVAAMEEFYERVRRHYRDLL